MPGFDVRKVSLKSWGKGLMLAFSLLGLPGQSEAQLTEVGPYDVYVSRQQPNQRTLYSGGAQASADEGRVININITNVVGPIEVSPTNFSLNGPVCPTYTATGHRVPEDPLPDNTANFSGTVKIKAGQIPAPGTSADAEFTGKDDGYWTKCSNGQKTFFAQTVKAKFKIHSLKLRLAPRNLTVCRDVTGQITIAERYPAAEGEITWQSVHGKVTITDEPGGCRLAWAANGDDLLVGTITAGGATYKDTVRLKVGELRFAQARYNYLVSLAHKVNLVDLLTPGSFRNQLDWESSVNGGAFAAMADPKIDLAIMRAGDNMSVKVKRRGAAGCEATADFRFYILDVNVGTGVACDGNPLPFTFTIWPADAAAAPGLLAAIAGLTPKSTPSAASHGNPVGTTVLTFDAVGATFNSRVRNMIWYATNAARCNNTSDYRLWGEGTYLGKAYTGGWCTIRVNADGGCVNGAANITQTFIGVPDIRTNSDANGWYGYVNSIGSFTKALRGQASNICHVNSQFRRMVQDEEDHHVGQIEGRNGVLFNDLWDHIAVVNPIMTRRYYGSDQIQARALCWRVFNGRKNTEDARSWATMVYPHRKRCAVESEAKAAVRASHNLEFRCAYPACP